MKSGIESNVGDTAIRIKCEIPDKDSFDILELSFILIRLIIINSIRYPVSIGFYESLHDAFFVIHAINVFL